MTTHYGRRTGLYGESRWFLRESSAVVSSLRVRAGEVGKCRLTRLQFREARSLSMKILCDVPSRVTWEGNEKRRYFLTTDDTQTYNFPSKQGYVIADF